MVKYLGIRKSEFKINIKSKRILKERLKIHNSINIIKKKFKVFLKKRYNYLENNLDDEIFTTEKIYMIPKNDLFTFKLKNGKIMGCRSSNLIKWIINYKYDMIPINIFTNELMTNSEVNRCIENCKNYLKDIRKKSLEDYFTLKRHINIVEKRNYERLNPNLKLKDIEDKLLYHFEYVKIFLINKCKDDYWLKFFRNKNIKNIDALEYLLKGLNFNNFLELEIDNQIILGYKEYFENLIIFYKYLKSKIDNKYFLYFINN